MSRFTPAEINRYFPVIGVVVFPGGVEVQRGCNVSFGVMKKNGLRGVIKVVNKRSMNKLALLVRSCGVTFRSVMTLSYGVNYPLSGRQAKRDLNHFLVASRRIFGEFEYVWVMEFQQRGAIHFHLACTLAPPTEMDRVLFARCWQGISTPFSWSYCRLDTRKAYWQRGGEFWTDDTVFEVHAHRKSWEAVRKYDGVGRYFAKYANKLRQKKVPDSLVDVGRFWGHSRGAKMPDGERYWGTDGDVRELALQSGRDLSQWEVLPKIILL